jgi:hypothetical protein
VNWPPLAVVIAAALGTGAAAFLIASFWRGTGLGIASDLLTFRSGKSIATHRPSSVSLVLGATPFFAATASKSPRWSKLILHCDDGAVFRLNDLANFESEIAYALLSVVCDRALAIRPNGQVDLGIALRRESPAIWRTRVLAEAGAAFDGAIRRSIAGVIISILLVVGVWQLRVPPAMPQQPHPQPAAPMPLVDHAVVFAFGAVFLLFRAISLFRRRAAALDALQNFSPAQPTIPASLISRPEPEQRDVLVAASGVPIIAKLLVVLAMFTFYIPLIGLVPCLAAMQGARQLKGKWLGIARACLWLAWTIAVLATAMTIWLVTSLNMHHK